MSFEDDLEDMCRNVQNDVLSQILWSQVLKNLYILEVTSLIVTGKEPGASSDRSLYVCQPNKSHCNLAYVQQHRPTVNKLTDSACVHFVYILIYRKIKYNFQSHCKKKIERNQHSSFYGMPLKSVCTFYLAMGLQ